MSAYPVIRLMLPSQTIEFKDEEIIEASLIEEQDPTGATLPINSVEFKIFQYDTSFSMFEGEIFTQLTESLPVLVYENIDGFNYLVGRYFLDKWQNLSEREFKFKVVNILGVLEKTTFDGMFFSTPAPLSSIVSQVLTPIGVSYTLHESLQTVERSGWLAPGNYRKALQQICFSAGAVISTARRQSMLIEPMQLASESIIGRTFTNIGDDDKLMDQSVDLLPLVSSIELISHTYTQSGTLETVFQETLPVGTHKIVFEKPLYNIVVDGPGFSPFVLGSEDDAYFITTEAGDYIQVGGEYNFAPNSLYLTLTEEGLVTITGYQWIDNQQSFFYENPSAGSSSNKITLKIDAATMVSPDDAQGILNRLSSYYNQRYEKRLKLLPSRLTVGSTIMTHTIHENYVLARMEKLTSNLVGFLSDIETVGIHVDAIYSRAPRTGIASASSGLTRNNRFRERTFVIRST